MIDLSEKPRMMRAVGFYKYLPIEHPESLLDIEVPKPFPKGRDILVEVKAISVNPADPIVRAYDNKVGEPPYLLGWDVAGVVEQVGPECTLFQPGDEVFYAGSLIRSGCNSEFHLVDERIVGRKPASLDFANAASLPLTTITAWEGLFDRFGISQDLEANRNKSILIIGAAGGVGSIAVQIANLAGLTVIGTASRPESIQWVNELGVNFVINHYEALLPQLHKIGFDQVDYIFCLNNTDQHWNNMTEVIAPQGKICLIVENEAPIALGLLKSKSVTVVWETMFTRSTFNTEDIEEQHRLLNRLAELVDEGKIRTTVTEKISPINAANLKLAHAKIESGKTIGKIVLGPVRKLYNS
ncbi:zinc-binding alcohol dehydrogenase family protein [Paenibacillus durus]|uniref:Zinc-type alcohol dehydrogenase-like protein n=1 Tax=Paenibacillus durus ATCC 35681 TaxID=1333534 RepID=A0A0F7FEJ3_PAEDU|nr:zinc-binding alcohol dehydrogenase family protein [Paenibacillus durus]AKG37370.1 NADPH:quinone reductase [Paenibacillus durus ATCC 35681]